MPKMYDHQEYQDALRKLMIESKLPICEIIDLNLYGIAQMAIADAGDVVDGLEHLNEHFNRVCARLIKQRPPVSVH